MTNPLRTTAPPVRHRPGCSRLEPLVDQLGRHGDTLRRCTECGAYAVLPPPAPAEPDSRYVLFCLDCRRRIPVHRPEPRIPLCASCAGRRLAARQQVAAERRQRAEERVA